MPPAPPRGRGEGGSYGSTRAAWEIRTAAAGGFPLPAGDTCALHPGRGRSRSSGRREAGSQSRAWGLAFPGVGGGAAPGQKAGLALRACRSFPAMSGALRTSGGWSVRRPHTSARGRPALAAVKIKPAAADLHSTREPPEGMWVKGDLWPRNIKKKKKVFSRTLQSL